MAVARQDAECLRRHGACLAIRTELFESLGRFDAGFPNNFNDVDLCLRARERGYDVVCVSAPGLIHSECGTRRGIVRFEERYRFYAKWAHALARPDPYYSESLAATEGISLNLEGWRGFRALLAPTRSGKAGPAVGFTLTKFTNRNYPRWVWPSTSPMANPDLVPSRRRPRLLRAAAKNWKSKST